MMMATFGFHVVAGGRRQFNDEAFPGLAGDRMVKQSPTRFGAERRIHIILAAV